MPGRPESQDAPARSAPTEPPDRVEAAAARRRRRQRWQRFGLALLAVAVVVGAALQAPAAVHDFTRAFASIDPPRLPWLAISVAAEIVSFGCYALLQDVLLRSGNERIRLRTLMRLSVAATGLRALLPIGVVPSSGWLLGEYRRTGVSGPVSLYAVLAAGYVSTVALLGLLLLGSAIAGLGDPAVLAASAFVLVGGSVGFVVLVHRLGALRRLERVLKGPLASVAASLVRLATEVGHLRVGRRLGAIGFASAAGNWLADLVCLVSAFALLGVSVPWKGLLFAYTVSQVAGSVIPLPGGLGAVEGGLLGALDLLGVSLGAALAVAIVYRAVTYWGVALFGGIELAILSRRPPGPGDLVGAPPPGAAGGEHR